MTKISLELDAALDKRLKQYALDHYTVAHGKQQQIIRDALIAFLDANEGKRQQKIIEIQPESVSEEVVEVCEPEPTPKRPMRKPRKAKAKPNTRASKKSPEVLALIKDAWGRTPRPTLRDISKEIKTSLEVDLSYTTVQRYAMEMGLQTEETEPETANVGE